MKFLSIHIFPLIWTIAIVLLINCSGDRYGHREGSEGVLESFAGPKGNGTGISGIIKILKVTPNPIDFYQNNKINIYGENFEDGAIVTITNLNCSQVVYLSASELSCSLLAISSALPRPKGFVVVTNPDGQSAALLLEPWISISTIGAPEPRKNHSAFWTGSEMLVFGGALALNIDTNTGGRYNPVTDSWTDMSTLGAPTGAFNNTTAFAEGKFFTFGGLVNGNYVNSGSLYDISSDSWSEMSIQDAPSPRNNATSVWTGTHLIVFGGSDGNPLNTGAKYELSTNTWAPISTLGAPSPRALHTATWAAYEMIVFGGFSSGSIYPNDHAKYSPTSDTWTTLATLNAPTARIEHSAVSTGNTVLIFGGGGLQALSSNNGAQYNPISDEWIPFSMPNDPTGRRKHTALWTGSKMIVYGGYDQYPSNLHSGGIFDPILNSWIETNPVSSKVDYLKAYGISGHSTVWTGSYLIMFGGIAQNGSHRLNEGAIYRPFDSDSDYSENSNSNWKVTSTVGTFLARKNHSAFWTGSEMLVFGGEVSLMRILDTESNTGRRYNPVTDSWSEMSSVNAPQAVLGNTSVWTGHKLITFGGQSDSGFFNTGGIFDASSNSWASLTTIGAPSLRSYCSSIWSGDEFIIFGGQDGNELNTGGKYNLTTGIWQPISNLAAPSPRNFHTATWAASEMVVFGGYSFVYNTGIYSMPIDHAKYNPASNTWTTLPNLDAPSGRFFHTAVSTGTGVLIFGGLSRVGYGGHELNYFNTGAQYNPTSNAWTPLPTTNAPHARAVHTAVWTGSKMIVFGGGNDDLTHLRTGGVYNLNANAWVENIVPPRSLGNIGVGVTENSAVWTGTSMILFGGRGSFIRSDGAIYRPD